MPLHPVDELDRACKRTRELILKAHRRPPGTAIAKMYGGHTDALCRQPGKFGSWVPGAPTLDKPLKEKTDWWMTLIRSLENPVRFAWDMVPNEAGMKIARYYRGWLPESYPAGIVSAITVEAAKAMGLELEVIRGWKPGGELNPDGVRIAAKAESTLTSREVWVITGGAGPINGPQRVIWTWYPGPPTQTVVGDRVQLVENEQWDHPDLMKVGVHLYV